MTRFKLALNSLKHYKWLNLAILTGVLLTSAILSGALVVGDSVRASLAKNAEARISKANFALVGSDRFFTTGLGEKLAQELDSPVASVLQTVATVADPSGSRRANQVQVVGVSPNFFELARGEVTPLEDRDIAINEALARRLDASIGDRIIASVEKPTALSKDAPLSGASNQPEKIRGKISRILDAEAFGRYNLNAEQIPVPSLFLPINKLQDILETPDQANVLLFGGDQSPADAISKSWSLADAGLTFSKIHEGKTWQLGTSRVFLDPPIVETIQSAWPENQGVITYLINKIRVGEEKFAPYSMVAGTDALFAVPLKRNEIAITDWLAEDLALQDGDKLELDFYVMGLGRKLEEKTVKFTVRGPDLQLAQPNIDRNWTPAFPGVVDAEDNADWEPGMPFFKEWLRKKDEDYWDDHNATPKAFVSLASGQEMWANRFGNLTSLHFPADSFESEEAFQTALRQKLELADFGILTRDLSEEARNAVSNSYDFGGLFAGMSFFLIIAALILTALVFVFGIEQRRNQIGLLLALGQTKKSTRDVFLTEATILSVIGAGLGLIAGIVYTKIALWGLGGAWQDAATGIEFVYSASPLSLIIAWFATVLLALGVVWLSTRSISKVQPSQLISGAESSESGNTRNRGSGMLPLWIAIGCVVSGIILLNLTLSGPVMARQGAFFGGGFLLVLGGIFLGLFILNRVQRSQATLDSVAALGRTNAVRRKWRSLSVMALMAAGVFMVTAINSLRLSGMRDAGERDSGTGGFAFLGESTLPVYEDLNSDEGRKVFGIEALSGAPDDFQMVQFRVSNGDDASCLNLNRAQNPRVLGVNPSQLAEREAFFFTAGEGWDLLNETIPELPVVKNEKPGFEAIVPGILDQSTAQYALGVKIGDRLSYPAPGGGEFHIQVAGFIDNSIFQGSVIIAEKSFIEFFPDTGGYQFFLMDEADQESGERHRENLTRQLSDQGLELIPTWQRLNDFNAVQNTYLSIFSTLGGLGLLLGTVGLGVVVSRNILERRGQMGLLEAIGFTKAKLGQLVVSEHWFLHVFGVILGILAGIIAVIPTLTTRSSDFPINTLVVLNALILGGGLLFCWLAARWMVRERLIEALRHE